MTKRTLALLVASGIAVTLTGACSTSSGGRSDSGSVSDTGAGGGETTTHVTIDVTGQVTARGSADARPGTRNGVDYETCAQYADGETRDDGSHWFVLPETPDQPVSGQQIQIGVEVKDYTGPATYPVDKITDLGGGAGIILDGTLYYLGPDGKSTVTVRPDGGGTWTFGNLSVTHADNTEGADQLTGTVTWTCHNG